MPLWDVRCYKSSNGKNEISEWYDDHSKTIQAEFDSALSYLIEQPRIKWIRPKASTLRGSDCSKLYEIRFKADNKQIRPLGYFGPQGNEFTILFCAIEKGDEFVPKDACKRASKRLGHVESDKNGYSCRCFCTNSGFDCCKTTEQGVQKCLC